MPHLPKIVVALDASEFVAKQFNFKAPALTSLRKFLETGDVELVVPAVTVEEVKQQARKKCREAIQKVKKAAQQARVLRSIDAYANSTLFDDPDLDALVSELETKLEGFLATKGCSVLPTADGAATRVLEQYFAEAPPFHQEKKKSEFPDAFAIDALVRCAESRDVEIWIASGDSGLREGCDESDRLRTFESIDALLDAINQREERARELSAFLSGQHPIFRAAAKREFDEYTPILDHPEGEVIEAHLNEDDIEVGDVRLISVEEDTATCRLELGVSYLADIEYWDLDTAMYDSEDKVLIPWDKVTKTVECEEHIAATAVIQYQLSPTPSAVITKFEFDRDFIVSHEDAEHY